MKLRISFFIPILWECIYTSTFCDFQISIHAIKALIHTIIVKNIYIHNWINLLDFVFTAHSQSSRRWWIVSPSSCRWIRILRGRRSSQRKTLAAPQTVLSVSNCWRTSCRNSNAQKSCWLPSSSWRRVDVFYVWIRQTTRKNCHLLRLLLFGLRQL